MTETHEYRETFQLLGQLTAIELRNKVAAFVQSVEASIGRTPEEYLEDSELPEHLEEARRILQDVDGFIEGTTASAPGTPQTPATPSGSRSSTPGGTPAAPGRKMSRFQLQEVRELAVKDH